MRHIEQGVMYVEIPFSTPGPDENSRRRMNENGISFYIFTGVMYVETPISTPDGMKIPRSVNEIGISLYMFTGVIMNAVAHLAR